MMRAPTQPIESRTARLKRSLWLAWDSDLAWSFRHSPVALGASVVALILLTSAMFAHWIAPQNAFDAASLNLMEGFTRPGEASPVTGRVFWLGSDSQGRDVFSAILYGSRVSLLVGFAAVIFSVVLGVSLGLVSGYIGGRTDAFIMRIADIQLSFPAILIALILLAILGKGVDKVVIALVSAQWAYYARTIRGAALVETRREYMEAARCLALPQSRIILRHLLPNAFPPLIVVATVQVAHAIALEATLSFLGVGVPITEPSLGLLIANGYQYLLSGKYWISFFPGIALVLTIVSINLVADQLRDVLNPRMQK